MLPRYVPTSRRARRTYSKITPIVHRHLPIRCPRNRETLIGSGPLGLVGPVRGSTLPKEGRARSPTIGNLSVPMTFGPKASGAVDPGGSSDFWSFPEPTSA